ncbi:MULTISPECIES: 5-formyltetrahydrofolate cyclo-ligase [unclassified Microcoleus]|uniref:5-formyltetrahydrofolate cyclo-ligase n=1 Tax=unclassified Microcoleus TaxID=2642155 RepID=UPI001DDD5E87|nr:MULTISPECIES: 5-formyltetrahydrofolate cyclo-ligase [unclassified Microcoleus]MCC3417412.1 5-formyltetrahydrofolate cyclo-ligase [Microcoleus sp. PH2017_07_MST_O_A]MCC3429856.1 5-formyltetrahydrofolate cyclo-ligase [Microcoleus sp. PH2017_04_SCI_O_A]MCC3441461.1 5-formyltetrahydrofolate cyclo-ligase [Microcoleus sp. PH2017_03_ELD_O_A]MCC3467028.1 5-formyltetrahydrofolate cyclo-ligase [Microcoleus sp. PH2017_06_SFM_O_A]MCC3505774.1 5-formyltetrahydrofolate cyclo-ligase [Microcoleus sp. PH201
MKTDWIGYHRDKDKLRTEIWSLLKDQAASVGDPFGHIPNFVGAELAAEKLASLPIWQQAKTIKCNPDSPQIPVRMRALQDGKRLYMAVPRLTDDRCFVELTAEDLHKHNMPLAESALAKPSKRIARKALSCGKLVSFEEMEPIDLAIVGCVAVARNGGRTGKGAGFADLELAMLTEFGLVEIDTPIVTTVHPLQIVEDSRLPMQPHDWALNWIVTAQEVIETNTSYPRPTGLNWDSLRSEQLAQIPILRKLREEN